MFLRGRIFFLVDSCWTKGVIERILESRLFEIPLD